jgi:hypothetical protein
MSSAAGKQATEMGYATAARCDGESIWVTLSTGRVVCDSVSRYPFLRQASKAARRVIEVGTFTGFSGLSMAEGLPDAPGVYLFRDGMTYSTTFGMPFFTVTGIHGTHVFIGVLWAIYILAGHRRRPYTKENHLGIENFGLYWHFVDIVWIALFTLIYLI